MIKTIFLILIIALITTLYSSLLVVIIIDLKNHLREEVEKRNKLGKSIYIIQSNARTLTAYTAKDELSRDEKDTIDDLYRTIKIELNCIEKLFRRGF